MPARRLAGLTWSAPCCDPANLAHVPPPAYPDLDGEYDLCIVGSGVGGAVLASRAAEAGLRVLIVETGDWISPDEMSERLPDPPGPTIAWPAAGDAVLKRLYKGAGVQVAGNLPGGGGESGRTRLLGARKKLRSIHATQTINVIQPNVVGGGPHINNAIYLEIEEETWNQWDPKPAGVSYAGFKRRMEEVSRAVGVNTLATRRGAGIRSLKFAGRLPSGRPRGPAPARLHSSRRAGLRLGQLGRLFRRPHRRGTSLSSQWAKQLSHAFPPRRPTGGRGLPHARRPV